VIAVRVLKRVGVGPFTDFMRRAGVHSPVPANLTAALGSGEVTPLELTNAYATLAAGGHFSEPIFIRRVEDREGHVLYAERPGSRPTIKKSVTEELTTMLSAVVTSGSGRRAAIPGVQVAGKTGTTSGRLDAWFIGYTVPTAHQQGSTGTVCGVWVGHDDNLPLAGGSGGATAAPLWQSIMSRWLQSAPRHADAAEAVSP
jgi:penicillin-binding protein 1A